MASLWDVKSMIVYEDRDILVCHKEAGIPVQSARLGTMDMENALKNHLAMENTRKIPYVGLIHRLDQPVEGLVLFAKNPKAAAELSRQMTCGELKKVYLAVTDAVDVPEKGEFTDFLKKDGRANISAVVSKEALGGREARLKYRVADWQRDRTLLEIFLDTGRHHQIRVQMAYHKMPLLGDCKYGGGECEHGLALCAYSLSWIHPRTRKRMSACIRPKGEPFAAFGFCNKISSCVKSLP
ncbi:MAG: RluA family pseudouridine synthase [Eubacteriales bacterium]|nr:RluA family pseudouridine synthase [Eubacteriales bacterium]